MVPRWLAPRRPGATLPSWQHRTLAARLVSPLRLDDAGIVERLLADPNLLRLPLVRHGNDVTVGRAEAAWTAWLRPASGP